jgi:hypothetical protein
MTMVQSLVVEQGLIAEVTCVSSVVPFYLMLKHKDSTVLPMRLFRMTVNPSRVIIHRLYVVHVFVEAVSAVA